MLVSLVKSSVQYNSVNRSENIGFSLTTVGGVFLCLGVKAPEILYKCKAAHLESVHYERDGYEFVQSNFTLIFHFE